MTLNPGEGGDDLTSADEVILRWRELKQQGREVSLEEVAGGPERLESIRRRLRELASMEEFLQQRDSTDGLDETQGPVAALAGGATLSQPGTPAVGSTHAFSKQIAGYVIDSELGRGGMGVVYKARQAGLNRTVALKMILGGAHADPIELARFRAEAAAIARLQHPNIVQVYEINECDGLPFFSLEFCAGGSLAGKLKDGPVPPAEAAALVETLAGAVAAAHRAGVIHRDLKPANVLMTADGVAKITDFGLAKHLGEPEGLATDKSGLTATGAVMGTPAYMAPEQARGEGQAIGPVTDIYALGAILYELLTGAPPFRGTSVYDTVSQVLNQEPIPVRKLMPQVPGDLETICLKCLEKDPVRRYCSAQDLAEDLGRFRAGEPIRARPMGHAGQVWRRLRRNPTLAGLSAAALVLLVSVVVLVLNGRNSPVVSGPAAPTSAEDKVMQVVQHLNKSDPNWRLEQIEAKRRQIPPLLNSATRVAAAHAALPRDWDRAIPKGSLPAEPNDPLNAEQYAAITQALTNADRALPPARQLATLPYGRHPVNYSRDGLSTLLPHAEAARGVAYLLQLDAARQAHDRKIDDALRSGQAALHAGRMLHDEPAAISQMVRIATGMLAVNVTKRALAHGEASEADLSAVQKALERDAEDSPALIAARAERGMLHWTLSAVEAGDLDLNNLDAAPIDPDLREALRSMPTGLAVRHAHAFALEHLTRWVDISNLPDHQQLDELAKWGQAAREGPDGARQLLPAAEKIAAASLRHRAQLRAAAAALAAERYRLQEGSWPRALSDLVPTYLSAVMADPFDGQPLRLRRSPDGVVVFSVGLDRHDDGGQLEGAEAHQPGTDIGFRLWDAAKRVYGGAASKN